MVVPLILNDQQHATLMLRVQYAERSVSRCLCLSLERGSLL